MTFRIFFFILIVLTSCQEQDKTLAPEINFYYDIQVHSSGEEAKFNALFLKTNIPRYKYAITNGSGSTWPFYQSIELNESVKKDSLMPPHWFVHKMIAQAEINNKIPGPGEYLVQIDLYPIPDTITNYKVTIFKMDDNILQLSATSGIHYIQPEEYTSKDELSRILLESVLRYSFK